MHGNPDIQIGPGSFSVARMNAALNRSGTLHKISRAQGMLEQKYHRVPNVEEIARELKLDEEEVRESIRIGNTCFCVATIVG